MFDLIATLLAWLYSIWPSFGGAIILLTLLIMVVLTPLTLKGTKSMLAMQQLQPELKKLQQKHKDDRQKLNEEMMKFYREHNINPVGGCLPLLVQLPVFFVLYRVIIGLTNRTDYGNDMGNAFGRAFAEPGAVFEDFGNFEPSYLDQSTDLFRDLSNTSEMRSFGLNLAESAQRAFGDGIVHALPILVLVAFVAATSYIQQRQVSGRSPQAQINPQQQMLLKLMPAFFAFISLTLPAGIVLYFFASNMFRIGQQAFITRTMYRGDGPIETTAKEKPAARRGLLASLLPGGGEATPAANGGGRSPAKKTTGAKKPASNKASGAKKAAGSKRSPAKKAAPAKKATSGEQPSSSVNKSSRSGSAGPAKSGAPSRQRPAAPANRSKTKRKRK